MRHLIKGSVPDKWKGRCRKILRAFLGSDAEDKNLKILHRLALGASVSAFLCFSLLVYGPLKLYVSGNDEMWFSFRSLYRPVILITLMGMVLSTSVLSLIPGKIHKLLCCLAFGVGLGFYIQIAFFNISYGSGVLDGSQIAWKDYTTYGAIDSAMWAACIALPFALFMVFKRSWRNILMIAAAFIMLLQIGGLAIHIYQNQNSLDRFSHEVTVEGAYELSEDDNTLVFVLGSMDRDYYEAYKAAHPEVMEELEGFTEYNNAVATGAGSIVSFPSLLTGEVYKKDIRYTDYIKGVWKDENLYDLLSDEDVDVRIFCDELYFSNSAVSKIENVVDRAQDSASYRRITSTMYRYTLYNSMPHYLKPYFWMSLSQYQNYKSNNTYSPNNDERFFADYRAHGGFSYTDDYSAALRVYYLQGAKAPYRLTKDGTKSKSATSREEQIEGDFNCILAMIEDLRKDGKYENARIIITADNGEVGMGQNIMLLYKDKGESKGYGTTDAAVTLFDLPATLASTVTDDYSAYGSGKTFKDVETYSRYRRRYFYRDAGSNADSRIDEYVTALAQDFKNGLKLVNSYYVNGGKIDDYKLGTELTFASDETAAIYCKKGFGRTNGWRTIMYSPEAVMEIPFDSIPDNIQDLHAYFAVLNIYEETRCVIYANDHRVYDGRLDSVIRQNGLNFLIPESLIGSDKRLTLRFSFPDIAKENSSIMALTSFKIYRQ